MNKDELSVNISTSIDSVLFNLLLKEFIDVERRFILCDWEPTTLNAGQLAEIASRIIYHIDSGNLNRTKGVDACLKYVEDSDNQNSHNFPTRRCALHLAKTIRTLYKFRSQRGAIHIDPDYDANELDAMLVLSLSRWIVSEILRIFWIGDTKTISNTIREIVRYEVPAILEIDERSLVLHTDCSVEEEILLLLHNAGIEGLSRTEIGLSIPKTSSAITKAIKALCSSSQREAIKRDDNKYILTPNGVKRIQEQLSSKLSIS